MVTRTLGLVPALAAGDDLPWRDRALCSQTDPEIFYPEKSQSAAPAKRVCMACEVRAECLEYALEHSEPWGVWGGYAENERRKLRRQARKDAAA